MNDNDLVSIQLFIAGWTICQSWVLMLCFMLSSHVSYHGSMPSVMRAWSIRRYARSTGLFIKVVVDVGLVAVSHSTMFQVELRVVHYIYRLVSIQGGYENMSKMSYWPISADIVHSGPPGATHRVYKLITVSLIRLRVSLKFCCVYYYNTGYCL